MHIIDFGTALLEGARRITWRFLSNAVGTPDYMAPEQIQGKRGDARTDIYALGIMLYDMLTGAPPFTGDNPLAVMNQHLTTAPTPPRELNKAIPPPVDGIILKAIRKNPEERYQLAGDMERDLANYQDLNLTEFAFGPERSLLGPNRMMVLGAAAAGGFILATALLAVLVLVLRG